MPVCASCGQDQAREKFSKAQLGKKAARRCKDCVANGASAGELKAEIGLFDLKFTVSNTDLIYTTSAPLAKDLGIGVRWKRGNTAAVGDGGDVIKTAKYSANGRVCVALEMDSDGRVVLIERKGIASTELPSKKAVLGTAQALLESDGEPLPVIPRDALAADAVAGGGGSAAAEDTAATPFLQYFAKLEQAVEATAGSVGRMIIRGVLGEEEGEEGEGDENELDEQKQSKYTAEEMAHMRWIIVTKSRAYWLPKMKELLLGDEAGLSTDGLLALGTNFSEQVLTAGGLFLSELATVPQPNHKLDLLLAFTYQLDCYDSWVKDHPASWAGGQVFLGKLAAEWKAVLQQSDEAVGIDPAYTRPAVQCMLAQFKQKILPIVFDI